MVRLPEGVVELELGPMRQILAHHDFEDAVGSRMRESAMRIQNNAQVRQYHDEICEMIKDKKL